MSAISAAVLFLSIEAYFELMHTAPISTVCGECKRPQTAMVKTEQGGKTTTSVTVRTGDTVALLLLRMLHSIFLFHFPTKICVQFSSLETSVIDFKL